MRRVSIFGATGSIGQNTLDLIRRDRDSYDIVALTGGRNVAQLAQDAREFGADIAVTAFDDALPDLRDALADSGAEAAAGSAAILEAADRPVDWIMSAIIGAAGLEPGMRALRHGATLALANKESLVCAGPLLMAEAKKHGARIMPVDSEHSAVFQGLIGEDHDTVEKVTITASGGAFRKTPLNVLKDVTPDQAMRHPNWSMGARITIDSASMFNKALELIETKEFFGFESNQIDAILHPESIVHAMVSFHDGGVMAHMGAPDMRHAIGFALNWPERRDLPVTALDLLEIGQLNFEPLDETRWPAIRLGRAVMKAGGLTGAAFNAAKERAMDGFIARDIRFTDMAPVVEDVLNQMSVEFRLSSAEITLDSVGEIDQMARIRAEEAIRART